MLTYIELKNFKSFSDITLNLQNKKNIPKRLAFIYGENGVGKSNIALAMLFLTFTFNTLVYKNMIESLKDSINNINEPTDYEKIASNALIEIVNTYRRIGTPDNEPVSVKIGFRLQGANGSYLIEFNNETIIKEELRYKINEREGVHFLITPDNIILSPSIFKGSSYKKVLFDQIKMFWGKHTFMGIIVSQLFLVNDSYIHNQIDTNFFIAYNWIKHISVWHKDFNKELQISSLPFSFMPDLSSGIIKRDMLTQLKKLENALNIFFTHLYSDVKSVYYKLIRRENGYHYELIFNKMMCGKKVDIPVQYESAGTQKLLRVFRWLISAAMGNTVIIDEIDNGIHDVLMGIIIRMLDENLRGSIINKGYNEGGQLIITTHNTMLMENLSIGDIYIIQIDVKGNKDIDCITDFEERTQKSNNIRKKYLRGDYGGIPCEFEFDFNEIIDVLNEDIPIQKYEDFLS